MSWCMSRGIISPPCRCLDAARQTVGRHASFSIATRMMSAPIVDLPGSTEIWGAAAARTGPKQRLTHSRRSPRNGCHASIFCSRPRPARRACSVPTRDGVDVAVVPNVVPLEREPTLLRIPRGGRRDIVFVGNYGLSAQYRRRDVVCHAHLAEAAFRRAFPAAVRHRRPWSAARGDGAGETAGHRRCWRASTMPRRYTAAPPLPSCRSGRGAARASSCSKAQNTACPIVATRFGAAGTGFRSGQELLLADNEQGLCRLLRETADRRQAGVAARGSRP